MKEAYFIDQLPHVSDVQFHFARKGMDRKAENYIIYCRESDEDQDRNKSIPDQLSLCQKLAEDQGLHVLHIIKEKRSARSVGRDGFKNLIAAIKAQEALIGLPKAKAKLRPDGIIAWHPDRLARNMRDAGEIIEMLDDELLLDMRFITYSFHNDSSGKEHLAMEFARAKGYSDHLSDNVLRGTMRQELKGKGAKHLPPAFSSLKKKKESDPDHLKIIPSDYHRHWRTAYALKLEGKTDGEIARILVDDEGYEAWRDFTDHKTKQQVHQKITIDGGYISRHLSNPLHCGLLIPQHSSQKRVIDLTALYPTLYGDEFPIVVTLADFKKIYPNKFSDTARRPRSAIRRTDRPLAGKVLCKVRLEQEEAAGLTYSSSKGGTGKPSHRFACQRCDPSHSIHIDDLFDAIAEKLKEVKLTEREHEMFIITEWEEYETDRAQFRATKKQIEKLKSITDEELEREERLLRNMQYGAKPASSAEIKKQKAVIKHLQEEKKGHVTREQKLVEESIERYYDLEAFLELVENGSEYWKKALEDQKRELADILISHVVIEGSKVVQITLAEPFLTWSRERTGKKNLDGGQYWIRTSDLHNVNVAL